MTRYRPILEKVNHYYTEKVVAHGPTHQGVGWNSSESQEIRFAQLIKVIRDTEQFSVNDLGCGYGHLFDYMRRKGFSFDYLGIDISAAMIEHAIELHRNFPTCKFQLQEEHTRTADYSLSSGMMNVKLDIPIKDWEDYVKNILFSMDRGSRIGFAFNCLTRYSDAEYMQDYLYYADPCHLFDFCKKNFSKNVALLHDYGLYDFTIIVRK